MADGLTSRPTRSKSLPVNWEVHPIYQDLRSCVHPPCQLAEGGIETPPEKLLQAIWFHQRLRREDVFDSSGRALQILHPGFWNRESGPDFRDAVLRWEGDPPRRGDVEIDLFSRGWRDHGHQNNPAYAKVILHVVWRAETKPTLPTLVLPTLLDSPLSQLAHWHGSIPGDAWPAHLAGQCRLPLQTLSAEAQSRLILDAAATRLRHKADRLAQIARASGWLTALWSGVFRALGYKRNPWPMQRLGELAERVTAGCSTVESLQARLLGVAGLLPHELKGASEEGQRHLRHYWDLWWRDRDAWEQHTLPRSLWLLGHQRPANHPQRRLALAAHWLQDRELPGRLEIWGTDTGDSGSRLIRSFMKALTVPEDAFWNHHWTLRSPRTERPLALLGAARVTDLAVNAVLPWLFARAEAGKRGGLTNELLRRYLDWPAVQDNAVLCRARHRLLRGEESRPLLKTAAAQQGLLQIVSDFCDRSDPLCSQCPFPDLVRGHLGE